MRYGEFDNKYFKKTVDFIDNEELNTIVELLFNFHPNTKPVLWRMLITQAMLYSALKNIRENKDPPYIKGLKGMTDEEKRHFDWRQKSNEATDNKVLNQPFIAAEEYLQNNEKTLYNKLVNGIHS